MDKPDGHIDTVFLTKWDSIQVEIEDNWKRNRTEGSAEDLRIGFYRTDASRNSLQGGSGIGLSIVQKNC